MALWNKDHAISLKHVTDWDQAKVIDRESNKMDRWIKEAIHIRKEQDKSMNIEQRRGILSTHTSMTKSSLQQLQQRMEFSQTIPKKATIVAKTSTMK